MRIDYDEDSRWPSFRWKVTGLMWYPTHAVFGKKIKTINYGWFGSKESAILWCSKQNVSYNFPS